jgi:hypothetical protein
MKHCKIKCEYNLATQFALLMGEGWGTNCPSSINECSALPLSEDFRSVGHTVLIISFIFRLVIELNLWSH